MDLQRCRLQQRKVLLRQKKPMHIRFQHTDIFHNESFGADLKNCTDVLFDQCVVLTDGCVFLAVRIGKSLTGRSSDDDINGAKLLLQNGIVCTPNISINNRIRVIPPISFLHRRIMLKCSLYAVPVRLLEPKAQASCAGKQIHNVVHILQSPSIL